jgi:hypothetical protein
MPGADARTALPNCRVLIVEDEYFLAQDLAVALQSRGAKIVALVGELGEALEQLARGGFDVGLRWRRDAGVKRRDCR